MGRSKLIILGLDGCDFKLVSRWVEEGHLRAFSEIANSGILARLKSTIPYISPVAWTSIFTGVNPGKHGVFNFVKLDRRNYSLRPVCYRDIRSKPLWEMLSSMGLRSIWVNIPFAYPPPSIKGVIVSGLGTPSLKSDFVSPSSYKKFIIDNFHDYDVDIGENIIKRQTSIDRFIDKVVKVTNANFKVFKHLITNEDWDLACLVLRSLDVVQHFLTKPKDLIHFYRQVDIFMKQILNLTDGASIIVCSDHGATEASTFFYINKWMEDMGLLKFSKKRQVLARAGLDAELVESWMLRLGMKDLVYKVKSSSLIKLVTKMIPSSTFGTLGSIEWENTKAYYVGDTGGQINLNLAGREGKGIVSEDEYNILISFLKERLLSLKDPNSGKRVIKAVLTKYELYSGNIRDAPDLTLIEAEGYRITGSYDDVSSYFKPIKWRRGVHSEIGIFMAMGDCIDGKSRVCEASVYDIAPTVLHMLNLPVPSYMDGNVLKWMFKEGSEPATRPVNYIDVPQERVYSLREKIRKVRLKVRKSRAGN